MDTKKQGFSDIWFMLEVGDKPVRGKTKVKSYEMGQLTLTRPAGRNLVIDADAAKELKKLFAIAIKNTNRKLTHGTEEARV